MSTQPIVLLQEYSTFAKEINLANDPNNNGQIFTYEHIDHPHKLYLKENKEETRYTCSNRILHENTESGEYSCKNVYVCQPCNYKLCLECYYKITTKSYLNEDVKKIQILGVTSTKNEPIQNPSTNYNTLFNLKNKISYYGDDYTFNTDQKSSKYECMRCSHSYSSFTEKFINDKRNICIYCANDITINPSINRQLTDFPETINNIMIDHPHTLNLLKKGYGQKCSSHNNHKGSTVLLYSNFFYCCEQCNYTLCLNCYKFLYKKSDEKFVYTKSLRYPTWSDQLITFPDIPNVIFTTKKQNVQCNLTLAKNRNTIQNGQQRNKYDYNCDKCGHLYKNNWDSYSSDDKKYDICPYCAKEITQLTPFNFRRNMSNRSIKNSANIFSNISLNRSSSKRKSSKRKSSKRKSSKRKSSKKKSSKRKSSKRKSSKRKSSKRKTL